MPSPTLSSLSSLSVLAVLSALAPTAPWPGDRRACGAQPLPLCSISHLAQPPLFFFVILNPPSRSSLRSPFTGCPFAAAPWLGERRACGAQLLRPPLLLFSPILPPISLSLSFNPLRRADCADLPCLSLRSLRSLCFRHSLLFLCSLRPLLRRG